MYAPDKVHCSKDFGFLGIERDFVRLMNSIGFRDYSIQVTKEVIGDPERDTESGPLFPSLMNTWLNCRVARLRKTMADENT